MYKIIPALVIVFCMAFASVNAQGIQSGKFSANPSVSGYSLDKNTGERSVSIEVTFKKPFDIKPTIVLSVTSLDADKGTNARYNVEAVSVSRDGFTIKVSTWADSKIFGIGGQWVAHAE